jgi:hypothetical protein
MISGEYEKPRTLLAVPMFRINGTVCSLTPLSDIGERKRKARQQSRDIMQQSAAGPSSKRLSVCVTLSPVSSVSQQLRRDGGFKQGRGTM